jgi:heme A synthase
MVVAVLSLALGIWLLRWEPPPSDALVSGYALATLISTLVITGLMILRAHQAAKQVAIDQVLEEEGDEIDAMLAEQYRDE